MQISIEIGGAVQVARELGAMGAAIVAAAGDGLLAAGKLAAANVNENYLSGQALRRRSGLLASFTNAWAAGELDIEIGVPAGSVVDKYKYLLGDETVNITPKKGRYLAIPIGEGLTGAGVARWAGPRQAAAELEHTFFFRSASGNLMFGYRSGKGTARARVRPLFVLVPSVTVIGTGALYDGVNAAVENGTVNRAVENAIGAVPGVEMG